MFYKENKWKNVDKNVKKEDRFLYIVWRYINLFIKISI